MTEEGIADKKLSRRQVIEGSAIGAAALGAGALLAPNLVGAAAAAGSTQRTSSPPATATPSLATQLPTVPSIAQPIPAPSSWNGTADVIVVGFGGAGAAAAYMAAQAGASVIILEKAANGGGSTALSYGSFAAAGTVLQTSRGIPDSVGTFFDFASKVGQGTCDPEVLLAYCESSGAAWLWLAGLIAQQCGVTGVANYPSLWAAPGFSPSTWVVPSDVVPRAATFNGSPKGSPTTLPSHGAGEWQAVFNALSSNSSVKIMTSTPAVGLITNNGEVVGVQALGNDSLSYFQAKRAVVIATGGFAYNNEMTLAYEPLAYYSRKGGSSACTGDGIRMGQMVGADLYGFGSTAGSGVSGVTGTTLSTTNTIWVNNRGQRFMNETSQAVPNSALQSWQICSWSIESAGNVVFNQDKMQAWAIFDNAGKGTNTTTSPVVSSSTLAGLATALGFDPTTFTNTVNVWNANAVNSTDPVYGRPINFFQISTPPFYACPLATSCTDTEGGLRINGNGQVLDTFGNPIPRLYAGGTTAGGVIGMLFPIQGMSRHGLHPRMDCRSEGSCRDSLGLGPEWALQTRKSPFHSLSNTRLSKPGVATKDFSHIEPSIIEWAGGLLVTGFESKKFVPESEASLLRRGNLVN